MYVSLNKQWLALYSINTWFLGAFAQLRKATMSLVMLVYLSVRPHGTTRLPRNIYRLNFISEFFFSRKHFEKILALLNLTRMIGTSHKDVFTFSTISRSILRRMMFQIKSVEKIKTHFLFSNFRFRKSCCLWDKAETCVTRKAIDDNII